MSNRHAILSVISKNPSITLDELVDVTGMDTLKCRTAVQDAKKAGLVDTVRDDVTGKPAYALTTKGKAWLTNRPDHEAQPEVAQNTGSKDAATSSAGQAVEQHAPETAVSAAPGACNEIPDELHPLMKTQIDFCEWVGREFIVRTPINLHEARKVIKQYLKSAQVVTKALNERLAVLEREHQESYDNWHKERRQREALEAGNMPQQSPAPLGYLVAIPGSHAMHGSAEDATKYAEQIVREEGCACVCAVIAEAQTEIVWKRAA